MLNYLAPLLMGFAFLVAVAVAEPASADILSPIDNPFNEPEAGKWFADWTAGDPAKVLRVAEKGDVFVRMRLEQQGTSVIERAVPLDSAWKSVAVSSRLRAKTMLNPATKTTRRRWCR
jgi:hypothetical protein